MLGAGADVCSNPAHAANVRRNPDEHILKLIHVALAA
jgi:hypothetical protein